MNLIAPVRRWILSTLQPLSQIPKVLKEVWSVGKSLVLLSLLFRGALAVIPALVLWVSKLLIDAVVGVQKGPPEAWKYLWEIFCAEVVLVVIVDSLSRISSYVDTLLIDRFTMQVSIRLLEHAEYLDLETFENQLFQDCLDRARSQTDSQLAVLSTAAQLLQSTINLAALVTAVAIYRPWLVILQLIAVVPVSAMEAYFATVMHNLYRDRTPLHRTMEYLLSLGTATTTIKEVKAFGLGSYIVEEYTKCGSRVKAENAALARKHNSIGALLTALGTLAYYAGYGFLVWQAGHHLITIGSLFFLSGAIQRSKWQMQEVFASISRAFEQTMRLGDVFEFFNMKPRVRNSINGVAVGKPVTHGFEFKNVSFCYAGSNRMVLNDISFSIDPGETIALVGMSGAGKTTLTKLMARMYDPTEGVILLDGKNLREYDIDSLRQTISIVFQDFVRYDFTAGLNIGLGDISAMEDVTRLDAAAKAGMAMGLISRLPAGYKQVVGKRFKGGVDLSGGEWQQLALSRACMREAQVLILDEPSAALDVRAEVGLFQHFAALTRNKMALLISHRFSTARIADRILVLENGRLKEQGTHEALIALGGEYATLFRMQAAGYQESANGNWAADRLVYERQQQV